MLLRLRLIKIGMVCKLVSLHMIACFTSKYSISIVGKEVCVCVCGGGGGGRAGA